MDRTYSTPYKECPKRYGQPKFTHGSHREEERGDDVGGHGGMTSQRQWKEYGWLQKSHRTRIL
jgi:hypothetical protein